MEKCYATGKNKDWINVKDQDGSKSCIDLKLTEWRPSNSNEEEVNVVVLPKTKHNDEIKAKHAELQKLRDFETYDEDTELA